MPTRVEIPDVGEVEFPDDMDTASIEDAIRTKILPQAAPAEVQGPPATPPPTEGVDLTGGVTFDAYSRQKELYPPSINDELKQQADELLSPYGYTAQEGGIIAGPQARQIPKDVIDKSRSILGAWINPQVAQEPPPETNHSFPYTVLASAVGGISNAASGVASIFSREAGDELAQFAADANAQAQGSGALGAVGRGVGSVAAFAPSMAIGGIPGVLAATTQMVAQSKAETRNAVLEKLRAEGWTDEAAVQQQADEAAQNAAYLTAATMPVYLGVGRGVAALTGKMLPNLSPTAKMIAQTATATGANVGTGALMRALEGQEAAPSLEQFTADALWGVIHGVGVRASERARQRAQAELLSRGFAYHEVMNPDPQAFAENMAKYGITAPETVKPYAQQDIQTGTPDGGVRPRSEIQEVPPAEGGEGVQPSGQGEPPPAAPVAAETVTPPAEQNFGPGAANIAEPFSTAKVIGAYNAKVDEQRAARGLPPLMSEARKGNEVSWDNAVARIEADPELPRRLTDDILSEQKKSVTDEEQSALLWRMVDLGNKRQMEADRIAAADTPEVDRMEAESRFADYERELQRTEEANRKIGTQSGRALQIRKLLANDDYTLPVMEAKARQDGAVISPDLRLKLKGISDTITEAEKGLEARKAEVEQADRDAALDERIKALEAEASKDPAFTPEVKSLADRIIDFMRKRGDEALKRFRSKFGQLNAGVDPTMLVDLIEIGGARFAEGLVHFSKWGARMVRDIGKGVEPYLREIWDKVNKDADDVVARMTPSKVRDKVKAAVKKTDVMSEADAIAARMKENVAEGKNLRGLVNKLAKHFVASGISERGALVDAVHGVLEGVQKGITRRQTSDLISGYGDFRPLSKDAVNVKVRELKGELQLEAKLEDVKNRIPLAKSGPERAKLSDEARRLQQQLNEAKKKYGVVVTDPEKQLKSATDAVVTRLRNSIVDLTNLIETGERPKGKTPVPETPEIARLRAMRDRVRSTLEDIEGKPEMTEPQRIAAAEKAMEGQIAELQRRIATGDTATRLPRERPRSAHLDALRAEKDALQAQLDELRAADAAVQEEKAFDALSRQAADLEGRLSRGELTKERTTQLGPDTELVAAARERVTAAKDALAKAREASPEVREKRIAAAAEALQRSIADYDRRIRTEDFTTRTRKEVPPELEALKAERDAMRKFYNELRNAAKPKMTPEEVANRNFKSRKLREIAEYKRRIAEGEFAAKQRKPFDASKDPETVRLAAEAAAAKKEFNRMREQWRQSRRTVVKKAWDNTMQVIGSSRQLVTSLDVSAPFRQGGMFLLGDLVFNPKRAGRQIVTMFRQLMSEKKFQQAQAAIRLRPNADLYEKHKLYLSDQDGTFTKREEMMQGELAEKIPLAGRLIRASSRAYAGFLNEQRADAFDAMVESMGGRDAVSPQDLDIIANTVNTFTGRGNLPEGVAQPAALLMFSPRYFASRVEALVGRPLWKNLMRGSIDDPVVSARVRALVAQQYARFAVGLMAVYGLASLAGGKVEKDSRSSDFGKVRIGNTRIDPMTGLQQIAVFTSRVMSGKTKGTDGRVKPADVKSIISNFARSKMAPIAGAVYDTAVGKYPTGEKATLAKTAAGLVSPISWSDTPAFVKEHGPFAGAVLQVLNLMGMGVNNFNR